MLLNRSTGFFYPTDPVLNTPVKLVFVSSPFISHKCNSNMKKTLGRLCVDFYQQIDLKLIISKNLSIESKLRFRDQTPVDILKRAIVKLHLFISLFTVRDLTLEMDKIYPSTRLLLTFLLQNNEMCIV